MGNKVIKSIGFNITNSTDEKMLNHISKKRNFSGYIKKLILADIQKGKEGKSENEPLEAVESNVKKADRFEALKQKQARLSGPSINK